MLYGTFKPFRFYFGRKVFVSFGEENLLKPSLTEHVDHPDLVGRSDVTWSGEQMILKNNEISRLGF